MYNLAIYFYVAAIRLASLFNHKAKLWVAGRKNIFEKLQKEITPGAKYAWFHAASLGEFEQGRPVIEAFRQQHPDYKIMLTFFSPSGYEIRKNYAGADHVFYLPADTSRNARRFIEIVQPKLVIFIKYEYWYNYLSLLKKKNIPLYLTSAIFRPSQPFFKWYGRRYRKMLSFFEHLFVQDDASVELLRQAGTTHATKSGDTRFDRVADIVKQAKPISLAESFSNGHFTFVAGSTWEPDEEILIEYINSSSAEVRFIIAPHEIYESGLQRIETKIKDKVIRFSQANPENTSSAKVLLIDSIGMLSSLYRYGKIAYIGGGFGKGIHNILEAATFGLPVAFGPNFQKFREARELVELGGATSISNSATLKIYFDELLNNSSKLSLASKICASFVENNKGATAIILNNISIL
jgi:3-deoxy-D-manno-octulosonic-acid transferase